MGRVLASVLMGLWVRIQPSAPADLKLRIKEVDMRGHLLTIGTQILPLSASFVST